MDIRGVEITNQLRSAIRAKLLELGVRYDEELPDYILVMVVNKKSRQQMNEDLHLFLEDSTEPFVNWLHDQVLKKLQKVNIARKKTNKDVPVVVKQEEEQKQLKIEDQNDSVLDRSPEVVTKLDRDREFEELVGDLALLNEEDSKSGIKDSQNNEDKSQRKKSSVYSGDSEDNTNSSDKKDGFVSTTKILKSFSTDKKIVSDSKIPQLQEPLDKDSDISVYTLKRTPNVINDISNEKNIHKRSKISNDSDSEDDNKLKSCINKPKITSVVSVKSRLGIISPSKKSEIQTQISSDTRNSSNKSQLSLRKDESTSHRNSFHQSTEKRKQRTEDLKTEQSKDDKSQLRNNLKNDKPHKVGDLRDSGRLSNKSGTIKSRLGISTHSKHDKISLKSSNTTKVSKPRISNVKSRLGIRNKQPNRALIDTLSKLAQNKNNFEEEEDDDAESIINTSLRSHIIAVKTNKSQKPKQKSSQVLKRQSDINKDNRNDVKIINEEDTEQCKVPSKVIVTPRPLKPLQPSQKRATKSLLLRAVAEANKSVVMQKKMDPCLKEQKPANKIKIVRDPWEGKILSVNLNSKNKKRFVMEKIQIELSNREKMNSSKAHSSKVVTDEHLDVVKSLFRRSDDKQKFLVTLNGYNNNILKERNSDDEERLEMEVNEDDELALINNQYEAYSDNDQMNDDHLIDDQINDEVIDDQIMSNSINDNSIMDDDQIIDDHNLNEEDQDINYAEHKGEVSDNDNSENLRVQGSSSTRKRRKLSPIVYTRSRSNSPKNKLTLASTVSSVLRIDKRPLISSVIKTVGDKSSEQCRYWPNCTLGIKCAYYHPEVLCSSFPACKFGEKCAYKHPKCKFGSACTKLGCIFSHPPVQCKYHPYCMKPGCPFSHPKTVSSLTSLTPDISSVRAKFTWKKKD